jgi:hypothetical protein
MGTSTVFERSDFAAVERRRTLSTISKVARTRRFSGNLFVRFSSNVSQIGRLGLNFWFMELFLSASEDTRFNIFILAYTEQTAKFRSYFEANWIICALKN